MSEINEEKNTELENSENATPAAEETSGKEASAPGKAEKKSAKPEKKPAEIRNGNPARAGTSSTSVTSSTAPWQWYLPCCSWRR